MWYFEFRGTLGRSTIDNDMYVCMVFDIVFCGLSGYVLYRAGGTPTAGYQW